MTLLVPATLRNPPHRTLERRSHCAPVPKATARIGVTQASQTSQLRTLYVAGEWSRRN